MRAGSRPGSPGVGEVVACEGRGAGRGHRTGDIASTCTISGQAGILLVEAKAHSKELSSRDNAGATPVTGNRSRMHLRKRMPGCER